MVDPLAQHKTGLFGKKKPLPPLVPPGGNELTVLARRLRLLEERYSRVENNIHTIEEHMNMASRDFSRSLTKMKSEVTQSHIQVEQMQERMLMFIKELDLLAKQEDVEVIKKYLKYWDPVKFVQSTHVEKIVKDVLSEMGLIERL